MKKDEPFSVEGFREWRKRMGFTQLEVALEAGMKQPALARIEAGRVVPREETVERLRAAGRRLQKGVMDEGDGGDGDVGEADAEAAAGDGQGGVRDAVQRSEAAPGGAAVGGVPGDAAEEGVCDGPDDGEAAEAEGDLGSGGREGASGGDRPVERIDEETGEVLRPGDMTEHEKAEWRRKKAEADAARIDALAPPVVREVMECERCSPDFECQRSGLRVKKPDGCEGPYE